MPKMYICDLCEYQTFKVRREVHMKDAHAPEATLELPDGSQVTVKRNTSTGYFHCPIRPCSNGSDYAPQTFAELQTHVKRCWRAPLASSVVHEAIKVAAPRSRTVNKPLNKASLSRLGLVYDADFNVLICKPCGVAVLIADAERHWTRTIGDQPVHVGGRHNIATLLKALGSVVPAASFKREPLPHSLPIPHLAILEHGFHCTMCDYADRTVRQIELHWNAQHPRRRETHAGPIARRCKLQRWTRDSRFFEVDAAPATLSSDIGPLDAGDKGGGRRGRQGSSKRLRSISPMEVRDQYLLEVKVREAAEQKLEQPVAEASQHDDDDASLSASASVSPRGSQQEQHAAFSESPEPQSSLEPSPASEHQPEPLSPQKLAFSVELDTPPRSPLPHSTPQQAQTAEETQQISPTEQQRQQESEPLQKQPDSAVKPWEHACRFAFVLQDGGDCSSLALLGKDSEEPLECAVKRTVREMFQAGSELLVSVPSSIKERLAQLDDEADAPGKLFASASAAVLESYAEVWSQVMLFLLRAQKQCQSEQQAKALGLLPAWKVIKSLSAAQLAGVADLSSESAAVRRAAVLNVSRTCIEQPLRERGQDSCLVVAFACLCIRGAGCWLEPAEVVPLIDGILYSSRLFSLLIYLSQWKLWDIATLAPSSLYHNPSIKAHCWDGFEDRRLATLSRDAGTAVPHLAMLSRLGQSVVDSPFARARTIYSQPRASAEAASLVEQQQASSSRASFVQGPSNSRTIYSPSVATERASRSLGQSHASASSSPSSSSAVADASRRSQRSRRSTAKQLQREQELAVRSSTSSSSLTAAPSVRPQVMRRSTSSLMDGTLSTYSTLKRVPSTSLLDQAATKRQRSESPGEGEK